MERDPNLDSVFGVCKLGEVLSRTRRKVAPATLSIFACLSILTPPQVRAAANSVIAPGQEQLLAAMLGRGETLPGSCRFSDGQVETALVRSTFQCSTGAVVIELRHADRASDAVATTNRFAIAVVSGSAPAGLVDALASRIRQRESAFVWKSPGAAVGEATASPFGFVDLDPRLIQAAWLIVILASPILCWRGARAVGVAAPPALLAVAVSMALAATMTWGRDDEPLHANGHAWREAREVLAPWGTRSTGGHEFLHGQSGIVLQRLIAALEMRIDNTANPFHISRSATAAAAGATALLTIVLVRSWGAGLAAGCALALMPLTQTLAVSGSSLTICAWILPWTLALVIAAGLSRDSILLVGAALAAALGVLSHTAMLAWPPALVLAWLIVARRRRSPVALGALVLVGLASVVQLSNVIDMVASRNQGPSGGLLGEAWRGAVHRNLFLDPAWLSPFLPPMVLLWIVSGVRRGQRAVTLASVLPLAIAAAPFFAVTQSSSDAVRYQGALLGLVTALAVAGLWRFPFAQRLRTAGVAILRTALLATFVLLPRASLPTDPVTLEHELVAEAVGRMEPGMLVILPKGRFDRGRVIPDFPDFMLPEDSHVVFEGDPRIGSHSGPRIVYLGLACVSWSESDGAQPSDLRPECRALRSNTQPWMVGTIENDDLPRSRDGSIWTFHRLATGVPFGFFAPEASAQQPKGDHESTNVRKHEIGD